MYSNRQKYLRIFERDRLLTTICINHQYTGIKTLPRYLVKRFAVSKSFPVI